MRVIQYQYFTAALILITLLPCFTTTVLAADLVRESDYQADAIHEFVIESFTFEEVEVNCVEGQILSGHFDVYCDGRLYPGDDQRYDDWMLESILFLILNETEYANYVNDFNYTSSYQKDAHSLSWQFKVPSSGKWYLLYYNPSIYLITVKGIIEQRNSDSLFAVSLLTVGVTLFILIAVIGIKKEDES